VQKQTCPTVAQPCFVQVPSRMFFNRKNKGAEDIRKEVEDAAKAVE